MYTATPPRSDLALATGTNYASLNRPLWTIPKADFLQMRAFARPPQQLWLKVRDALLRSLHKSALYRGLIVANKKKRARTNTVGPALYIELTLNPKEGTPLAPHIHIWPNIRC